MASIYDPQAQSGVPNLLGTSQGISAPGRLAAPAKPRQPRQAVEQERIRLFEGVDEPGSKLLGAVPLIGALIGTADQAVQAKIQSDVQQIHDDALSVFEEKGEAIALPHMVNEGLQKLHNYKKAHEQGDLSDVRFYANINTEIRKLKVRYPGYRDVIDETVQSVTGVRPANALRTALMQEQEELDRARSDEEKFKRNYWAQNDTEIKLHDPAAWDHPERYESPEGFAQLQSGVAGIKANSYRIAQQLQGLQLKEQLGNLQEEEVYKVASEDLTFDVITALEGDMRQLGYDAPGDADMSLQETMAAARKGEIPAEEMVNLAGAMRQHRDKIRRDLELKILETNVYNNLRPEDRVKVLDQAMAPYDSALELLGAREYDILSHDMTVHKIRSARDVNDLVGEDPLFRTAIGLEQVAPIFAQKFILENDSVIRSKIIGLSEENSAVANELTGQMATGRSNVTQIVERLQASPGLTVEDKNQVGQALLEMAQIVSGESSVPQSERLNTLRGFYVEQNPTVLFTAVPPEDRLELYRMMVSPRMSKAIKESGDRQVQESYIDWASRAFISQIPEINALASDVREGVEYGRLFDIQYDPNTFRLVVSGKPDSSPGGRASRLMTVENIQDRMLYHRKVTQAVPALNTALQDLAGAIQTMGGEPNKLIPTLLNEAGAGLGSPQQPRLWDSIRQAVEKGVSGAVTAGKEAVQSAAEKTRKFQEDLTPFALRLQNAVAGGEYEIPQEALDIVKSGNFSRSRLRDMISLAEGADYNTVFSETPDGKHRYNLTGMSVGEVHRLGPTLTRTVGSSAAGRYQVMHETLGDAIRAGAVDPNEPFDEDAQDRIADWLISTRTRYSQFRSGKVSKKQLLNDLAGIWAGLPNSSGESPYKNVGLNKGATSTGRRIAEEFN
jgi:hypothetical protein